MDLAGLCRLPCTSLSLSLSDSGHVAEPRDPLTSYHRDFLSFLTVSANFPMFHGCRTRPTFFSDRPWYAGPIIQMELVSRLRSSSRILRVRLPPDIAPSNFFFSEFTVFSLDFFLIVLFFLSYVFNTLREDRFCCITHFSFFSFFLDINIKIEESRSTNGN